MANIFKRFTEVVNKPNRATYDLSFQNNVTLKFGTLYPVFCKEVLPGDSFRIKPTFGFNFMPMVSPVQTRMRAHLHFFYVRNRPHWKDFMDWDGMTKEGLIPPYIKLTEQNRDMFNTGSIGDFLGVPTRIHGLTFDTDAVVNRPISVGYPSGDGTFNSGYYIQLAANYEVPAVGTELSDWIQPSTSATNQGLNVIPFLMSAGDILAAASASTGELYMQLKFKNFPTNVEPSSMSIMFLSLDREVISVVDKFEVDGYEARIPISGALSTLPSRENVYVLVWNNVYGTRADNMSVDVNLAWVAGNGLDASETTLLQLPWASTDNPEGMRINAFPFRAYEAIYNSFYRDDRNNPRIVNGQPEYNKFITTDEGGADTTRYQLYNRNWESDFLTTAVQSPQQGVAPLVGITSVNAVGDITLTDSNGTEYTAKTTLAEDGDTIVGINITSGNGTSSVNRALVDMASTGISISDLRNVNALQRWLEINMRRGLRYRDQVMSHYGVDIEYKELNMPEFIGGVSEDVIVNRISQTTETEANPLGSLAGQAGVIGTSKHDISHYCDEKGYIIGILSIAPVPNYSQLLPKHLIKSSQLDYFTPEFAHIGMQPILNSEVTPLQANLEGKLNDVFGYQRPWYDYLASVDEVHGEFRDSLRRYLINRVFDGTPELGSEFLTIDSTTINDVFAVTDDTDKIYGQIYFDVTAKRPIAANVTPRIEP